MQKHLLHCSTGFWKNNMDINEVKNQYLIYISVEKGLAKNTKESYARDLDMYFIFFTKNRKKKLEQINEQDIDDFLQYYYEKKHNPRSLARFISTMHSFYKFLNREKLIQTNPWKYIEAPKFKKKIPVFLTVDEVQKLIYGNEQVRKGKYNLRNQLMIEVLYATGVRVSELLQIKVSDINFPAQTIRIRGKGKKERLVPLPEQTISHLINYLDNMNLDDDAYFLFSNKLGIQMTRQGFWKIIKQRAQQVGILKEVSPHVLRHTFATHLLSYGADLKVVQELLGHEDITTTQMYTHVNQKQLFNLYHHMHPHGDQYEDEGG